MSTFSRVSKGIRTGGQFAPNVRSEPSITFSDPAVRANLTRPIVQEVLTPEQIQGLHRHRTPITDAAARLDVAVPAPDLSATDATIHAIRERLNRR